MDRRTSNKVKMIRDFPDDDIQVKINASLFEWVIENLSKNAVDAMGGEGTITLKVFEENRKAVVEVTDTGKGIDKETETKLFSPFFSTKPNGQGIGLIFIREVLLKHDCRFSLRSYADGLTRFKIWFS